MLYSPLSIFFEKTRLLFKRRVQDGQLAYLGDSSLPGARVEIPDKKGYVYCRFPGGVDANGNAKFSTPFPVRSAGAPFLNYPGAAVYIAYGKNNELQIVEAHYAELDKAGIDTRTLNPLHQQSKWVYKWQLTIGLASAVANSVNDSFLVTVKKYLRYFDNVFASAETGEQADKIDLTAYMPAADMHRYAAVWLDAYTGAYEVTTSTVQSLFSLLDDSDLLEVVAERPPDGIPHKVFYLANNAGTIKQNAASDRDLRQFLNMPQVHGFPNPVAYRERIHPDKQQLFTGSMVVTGSLEVLGSLVGIDRDEDDSGNGSSGMTDFTVAADSGTPVTIEDGNTLSVLGGDGIATVASATDTITAAVDATVIRTTGTQAIGAGLTITTPTIADFTNAQHDHQDTDDGGQLTDAALSAAVGIAKGGTGQTTQTAAFDALAPTTTKGDIAVHNGTDNVRRAVGTNGDSLIADSLDNSGVSYNLRPFVQQLRLEGFWVGSTRIGEFKTFPAPAGASYLGLVPWTGRLMTLYDGTVWRNYDAGPTAPGVPILIRTEDATQTATRTSGTPNLTGLTDTSQLIVGMVVSGTGIPGGTTVSAIPTGTTITMSANASSSGTNAVTFQVPLNRTIDIFAFVNAGAVKLEMVLWNSSNLTRITDLDFETVTLIKDGDPTRRYVGSASTDTVLAGIVLNGGGHRMLFNAYNQEPLDVFVEDTVDNWSYTSATIRQARNSTDNQIEILAGLDMGCFASLRLIAYANTNGASVGIGLDSTTTYNLDQVGMRATSVNGTPAFWSGRVPLGRHIYSWNEAGIAGNTFLGDSGTATLQSGMTGHVVM